MKKASLFTRTLVILSKIILFLLALTIIYFLPGESQIHLGQYVIELPTGVLLALVLSVISLAILIWRSLNWLQNLPQRWQRYWMQQKKREINADMLVSFVAIASGEVEIAYDLARKVAAKQPSHAFADIIQAQAAFQKKDFVEAEKLFRQLAQDPEKCFLGYRGLLLLQQQGKIPDKRADLLVHALKARPSSPWILQQLLHLNIRHRAFDKAELVIEQLRITGALSKVTSRRQRGIVFFLKAEELLKEKKLDAFYEVIHRALKMAPDLTAATLKLADYYQTSQRPHRAWKVLRSGYTTAPHEAYLEVLNRVFPDLSRLEQYQKATELTQSHPHHPATLTILATQALKAKLWGQARLHLSFLKQKQKTQAYFRLMAELEMGTTGSHTATEAYLEQASYAHADPSWICHHCHTSHPDWHAFCQACDHFDTLDWQSVHTLHVPQVLQSSLSLEYLKPQ